MRTALALPPSKRPIRSPEEVDHLPQTYANSNFTSHYLETEIDSERVGVTLWDSHGLQPNVVDLQLREITSFLESKFEDTFAEEMKVVRSPGVQDTHIHCAFLILDPVRLDANIAAAEKAAKNGSNASVRIIGGLDEDLDIQVLRTMQGKTTVVPVISKADTITTAHMAYLKKIVWESLKIAKIDPLEVLTLEGQESDSASDDRSVDKFDEQEEDEYLENSDNADADADSDDDDKEGEEEKDKTDQPSDSAPAGAEAEEQRATAEQHSAPTPAQRKPKRTSSLSIASIHGRQGGNGDDDSSPPLLPLSILSPDPYSLKSETGPIGRHFPWGFADPYNPEHCDFVKLKESVFGEWRGELREASREVWYEGWRTSRLHHRGNGLGGLRNGVHQQRQNERNGRATR